MIAPDVEQARSSDEPGFADAVTVSFADAAAEVYGTARIGLGTRGSALAVLFRGREPVAALASGDLDVPPGAGWTDVAVGGLRFVVEVPLERWTAAWDGRDAGFALSLEAVAAPAAVSGEVARIGGMDGYEQLVRVTGTVRVGGGGIAVDGLGQRGRSWGVADWSRLSSVRTVSAWLGADRGGIMLSSLRAAGAEGHDEEAVWAAVIERGEAVPVSEPRLSTTYDLEGHQRRAGLELWMTEEGGYPHRAAGEVICGSSLDLGALRLETAFMRWVSEGADGVGRYDVLRRG